MSRRRRARDPDLHGVLLIDKPAGPTSHDVVSWVRWVLGMQRVGHCGTLDPAATGLLVVGLGLATKLAPYLTGQDKGYRARFVLGARTRTADAEGEVLEERACPEGLEDRVGEALLRLRGEQQLPPPAYSAVHVDGRRAHELARQGVDPELAERTMVVHALDPGPVRRVGTRVEADATLFVSKGTYVRSLAEALGRMLEMPAHLGALHRTRCGSLTVEDPRLVDGLVAEREPGERPRWRVRRGDDPSASKAAMAEWLRAHVVDPADAVPLPLIRVHDDERGQRALARLASGQPLDPEDPGLCTPAGPVSPLAVAAARPPGLVVVHRCTQDDQTWLQTERVIVPPPTNP